MGRRVSGALRHCRRMLNDESGGVAAEYMLWLPMVFFVFGLTVDATLLMQKQSQFYVAARDASQLVALGHRTEIEAEAYLSAAFPGVDSFSADVSEQDGFVTSTISAPFSSFVLFADTFSSGTLRARVVMWSEAGGA